MKKKYYLTDRSGLIIRPTDAYMDWLASVEPDMDLGDLEEHEPEIFLIPELEEEEMDTWLEKNYLPIFQEFLFSWYEEESLWPKDLSFQVFLSWFEVEFVSMVWDKESN